jgi:MFS family permease
MGDSSKDPDATARFTVDDAVNEVGFGRFQVMMLLLCGAVWAADAMEMMLLSFLLPEARKEWPDLTPPMEALIGSLTFAGMVLGSYSWGSLADRFGRRPVIAVCCVFTGVFGIASAFSPDPYWLMASRAIVGIGLGGAPVAFTLFAEFLPAKNRGIPMLIFEGMWTVGTLGEAGLAWVVLPNLGWRWLLIISSAPVIVLAFAVHWLPEVQLSHVWILRPCVSLTSPQSPRFLMSKGKSEQAMKNLARMARMNRGVLRSDVLSPLSPEALSGPSTHHSGLSGLWYTIKTSRVWLLLGSSLRRTTLCLWLIWFANSLVCKCILGCCFFRGGGGKLTSCRLWYRPFHPRILRAAVW